MAITKKKTEVTKPQRPPSTTPNGRENQLIAMAYDYAEQQMKAGTASSQIVTHLLKMGTEREKTEREKLTLEKKLVEARTEQIGSAEDLNKLAAEAMNVFRGYAGQESDDA